MREGLRRGLTQSCNVAGFGCQIWPSTWERRSALIGSGLVPDVGEVVTLAILGWSVRFCNVSAPHIWAHEESMAGEEMFITILPATCETVHPVSKAHFGCSEQTTSYKWVDLADANRSVWALPNRAHIRCTTSGCNRHFPGGGPVRERYADCPEWGECWIGPKQKSLGFLQAAQWLAVTLIVDMIHCQHVVGPYKDMLVLLEWNQMSQRWIDCPQFQYIDVFHGPGEHPWTPDCSVLREKIVPG